MESRAEGRNRNSPIPVARPHDAIQTTRAAMIFSSSNVKPAAPHSNKSPIPASDMIQKGWTGGDQLRRRPEQISR